MEIILGLLAAILAYFLGSIPFGLLLTKKAGLGDVRNIGSGNIGATNVLRTGNKKIAAATLFLDCAKGALAVFIAQSVSSDFFASFSGLMAVIGHIFPVWLKFKGGKGVATTLAVYLAVFWPLGVFACACWLFIFFVSRISSLSSVAAMLLSPVIAAFFGGAGLFPMSVITGAIVVYRHKENIIRLLRGEEKAFK